MLMKVHRCKYCEREITGRSITCISQNPFCATCLPERMARASEEMGPVKAVRRGHYVHFVPVVAQ